MVYHHYWLCYSFLIIICAKIAKCLINKTSIDNVYDYVCLIEGSKVRFVAEATRNKDGAQPCVATQTPKNRRHEIKKRFISFMNINTKTLD
jgi:hypothetical protein